MYKFGKRKVGRKDDKGVEMYTGDIVSARFTFMLGGAIPSGDVLGTIHAITHKNGILGGVCLNYDDKDKIIKLTEANVKRYFQRIGLFRGVEVIGTVKNPKQALKKRGLD